MIATYNEIKLEIENFLMAVEGNELLSKSISKYYKGIQVFLSPLIYKPKFMFIGINPGAGYYKYNGKRVKRLNPLKYMEYVGQNYRLAKETRMLFNLAGISNLDLKNSVKTNYHFLSTNNTSELYSLLRQLKIHNINYNSSLWINKLIDLIQPEFIICEGKTVFEKLLKDKKCEILNKNKIFYSEFGNIKVIGYERLYSNILEKKKVADFLRQKLSS